MFDGTADELFDTINVVGFLDADEAAVGFGYISSVCLGFKLIRHVGTEFLLGCCQYQAVHFRFDAEG